MREPPRIKVLIAEDEEMLGTVLEQFLTSRGHQVVVVRDGRAALDALRRDQFDVALLDIVMPELDGLEVLRQLVDEPAPPQVIIITGNGTIETAITAIRLGAYDYLSKPYRMAEIDVLVRRAWEKRQLARENAMLQTRLERVHGSPELITRHGPMLAVLALVERVAKSDSPVLITGEAGTGKELVARLLHRLSGRADAGADGNGSSHHAGGGLVEVDCASLADGQGESELFGHEKGAFPGVLKRKTGAFELAGGGTLFLDEISALDIRVQGKLLRALETGSYSRLGGPHKLDVEARVVAGTKSDLAAAVNDRTFRSDLYYRINTISIALPPLRERTVDIPLLAEHFLRQLGGLTPPTLTPDALAALEAYPWPGNVRELRNVIERAVLLANTGVITRSDLPLSTLHLPGTGTFSTDGDSQRQTLSDLERRHIEAVLVRASWHQGRAAAQLGISSKTLYRKIREYGFVRPRSG
jgi:DNA-binding NtrC family response regulator